MEFQLDMEQIVADFKSCTKVLHAIGDETRQLIIAALLQAPCEGLRVGRITGQTHLSRPSVSHHLRILKDAGVVQVNKDGTKNYYYLDASSKLTDLKKLVVHIDSYIEAMRKAGYHV